MLDCHSEKKRSFFLIGMSEEELKENDVCHTDPNSDEQLVGWMLLNDYTTIATIF